MVLKSFFGMNHKGSCRETMDVSLCKTQGILHGVTIAMWENTMVSQSLLGMNRNGSCRETMDFSVCKTQGTVHCVTIAVWKKHNVFAILVLNEP